MPVYEYQCEKCLKVIEKLLVKAEDYKLCPFCGGVARRVLSLSSFQFKGNGFYTTDYKQWKNK